jgi:TIR domain
MSLSPNPLTRPASLPTNLSEFLAKLSLDDENAELVATITTAVQRMRPVEVVDLWEQEPSALTYWILLVTGVNQEDEVRVAKDLLAWHAFFSKNSARVLCIQSSDRESFQCCSRACGIYNFPTLIMSDRPDIQSFLKMEAPLLHDLVGRPGGLHSLFARMQSMVENGMALPDIHKELTAASTGGGNAVSEDLRETISIGGTEEKRRMAKKHIFLSYCHDNDAQATQLHDDLIAAGEAVWWDKDLLPGQDWKHEIRKAMKDSYAVVICFSAETEARKEAGIYPEAYDAIAAYREHAPGSIFLIPLRLSQCQIPSIEIDATRTLDSLQRADLFPVANWTNGVQQLIRAVQNTSQHP